MAGFEKVTVAELRSELINMHNYSEAKAGAIIGKSRLVFEIVQQRQNTEEHIDNVEDTPTVEYEPFEVPEDNLLLDHNEPEVSPHMTHDMLDMFTEGTIEEEVVEAMDDDMEEEFQLPPYGTKAWQDFIISELREDEIYKGNPLHTGLRRLTERYLGDIVSSGPIDVQVTNDINHPGRATVIYEIEILWKIGTPEYIGVDYIFEKRTFRAVAECWTGNAPATFSVHPAATAETKAASRAFKTALMLNVHTADEMSNDKDPVLVVSEAEEALFGRQNDWTSSMQISSTMKSFILDRCTELGIDVDKFMNIAHYVYKSPKEQEATEPQYKELDDVSKEVGRLMIAEINKYQSDTGTPESKEIPPVLLLES